LLTPTSLGLILATFPAERRGGGGSQYCVLIVPFSEIPMQALGLWAREVAEDGFVIG
jgi:hypothetical protein